MSLLSNAKWNGLSQLIKVFSQLINLIYLAKIIPPAQYGLMAMASVIITLGILLRDLGTASAIIQKKTICHRLINTVFWFNVSLGFFIFLVVMISSPIVAKFYGYNEIKYILLLISVIFPLSSLASAHLALMERESKFKVVSLIEIFSSVISVIVAIILAKLNFGVYSLVWQAIILNFSSMLLFWFFSDWKPSRLRVSDFAELKSIFSFSYNLSLFNIINYLSRNADSIIIGKFMTPSILGSYNLAYRIMLFPLQSLTFVMGRSLYPVLSRHQDDNNIFKQKFYSCLFFTFLITAPLMTGVAIFSKPFIILFFGEKWLLTSSILIWLAPTAILQSIMSTTGALLSAKGKTDILMKLGFFGAFVQVSAFIIGVQYNIQTFAMFYLIANVINFIPVILVMLNAINSNLMEFIHKLFSVLISLMGMCLFLYFLNNTYTKINSISSIWVFMLYVVLSIIIYFITLFILDKNLRLIILNKIK